MRDAPGTDQGVIFINYRRTDAGWTADLLNRELERIFGEERVFLDVHGIQSGDEFAVDLEEQLRRASVFLVLIGNEWLFERDKFGRRRIDLDDDWVRREIRTALQKPDCRVIPVLIDNADLPNEREAFPGDIADLAGRQRMSVRQAHSETDIEEIARELERAGFRRLSASTGSAISHEYTDSLVIDVATTLQQLKERQNVEFATRLDLTRELNRLFNRKTFRFEPVRDCPEQRWGDRLGTAYQTERLLRDYERNVQEVAEDKYDVYVEVLKEVGRYCMQMGSVLFTAPVDVARIREHIGKPTFAAQLPPAIQFPTRADRKPIIPDAINDAVEKPRKRAVTQMNKFRKS
jgi:hypothetical protein